MDYRLPVTAQPTFDRVPLRRIVLASMVVLASSLVTDVRSQAAGERVGVQIRSRVDQSLQPSMLILPEDWEELPAAGRRQPRPLLVSLHSWSGDWTQRNASLEAAADELGWFYLHPNFRGANDEPLACGSPAAQQDIVDAIHWCLEHYPVDPTRIYLTGVSGGGHMTLLMAGRTPDIFAAASAWVGISDLKAWHEFHRSRRSRYDRMMEACCGGAPGKSVAVDHEYEQRSPLSWLHNATELPLDIAAGVHDGHTGSVPVDHSLRAFNVVAGALDQDTIDDDEMAAWVAQEAMRDGAVQPLLDSKWGRRIWFRRQAGQCRVTLFEGGHEGLTPAAIDWLSRYTRDAIHRHLLEHAIIPYVDVN